MAAKAGQKMLTLWVDEAERDALQNLCKTNGISVSSALRSWILTAVQEQSTNLVPAALESPTAEATRPSGASVPPEMLKELMTRMASLEKSMPNFDEEDLIRMRDEVLGSEFGTMRHRIGVVEAQLQSLGGSISWSEDTKVESNSVTPAAVQDLMKQIESLTDKDKETEEAFADTYRRIRHLEKAVQYQSKKRSPTIGTRGQQKVGSDKD